MHSPHDLFDLFDGSPSDTTDLATGDTFAEPHHDPHWLNHDPEPSSFTDPWQHHVPDGHGFDAGHDSVAGQDPSWGDSNEHLSYSTGAAHHFHFSPDDDTRFVVGDPASAAEHWHGEQRIDSCAIATQRSVLEQITGDDTPEGELMQQSIANGWYRPGGTTPEDIGKLLDHYGIEVERPTGATLADVETWLADGHAVLASVNAEVIDVAAHNEALPLYQVAIIPGQEPSHVVQITGIDRTDPTHPMVVVNDPSLPDGAGLEVPWDGFERGWALNDHLVVRTTGFRTDGTPLDNA